MRGPIPPLAPDQLLVLLVQLSSLLLLGLCLGRLAARLGLPAIVGELTAGVLLGPSLLGHAAPAVSEWLFPVRPDQQHLLDAVGQFGILLFVGIAGVHLDVRLLRRRGTTAGRVSISGLVIPLVLGILIGYLVPASLLPGHTERVVFASFLGVGGVWWKSSSRWWACG